MLAIGNLVPMVPASLSDETASDSKTSSSSIVMNLMDTGTYISLTHLYLMAKRWTYPSELHLLLCFIVFYFSLFLGCEVRYFFCYFHCRIGHQCSFFPNKVWSCWMWHWFFKIYNVFYLNCQLEEFHLVCTLQSYLAASLINRCLVEWARWFERILWVNYPV